MQIILSPRGELAYGQDFVRLASERSLHLKTIVPNEEGFYEIDPTITDLVISHNLDNYPDSLCIRALPKSVAKIVHLHVQWDFLDKEQKENISNALENIDILVVPANFMKYEINKIFPQVDCRVIHNGVDTGRYRPAYLEEKKAFRKKLGLEPNTNLTIHVGRLEKAKGLEVLREYVRCVHAGDGHILLQFPGYGRKDLVEKYRNLASELCLEKPAFVHLWEDRDPATERPVRFCDKVIHPSLSEVCPLVVLEALFCGVPVVATCSTPFYKELDDLGLPPRYFQSAEIPQRLQIASKSRSDLSVSSNDATNIAANLLELSRRSPAVGGTDSQFTSELLKKSGFSQDQMLDDYKNIYLEAMNDKKNK